jgi:glutamate-1-semialdehyde aminotransferase
VGLTRVIEARGAPWLIGGKSSVFHWLPGEGGRDADGASDSTQLTTERKAFRHTAASEHMRNALLRRGVDFPGYEGWLSAEHTEEDIEFTIDAFDSALMETEEACP